MAHPKYWWAGKEEFTDAEMYYIIYAQQNGIRGLAAAAALGIEYGVVYAIYQTRMPYMEQALFVGRNVQWDKVEDPRAARRVAAATFFGVAVAA